MTEDENLLHRAQRELLEAVATELWGDGPKFLEALPEAVRSLKEELHELRREAWALDSLLSRTSIALWILEGRCAPIETIPERVELLIRKAR